MTGENFKRIARHDEKLEQMKCGLERLRNAWGNEYYHQTEEGDYDMDRIKLERIEQRIDHLKSCMYVYVYNRYGWAYANEFDRRVLW